MSETTIMFMYIPGLFVTMMLLLEIGRRVGMRRQEKETARERQGLTAVNGAIFGLLGLMVAFTFSGAATRFEARRVLIVEEANAIREAYLRLDLLPVSVQPTLREEFLRYTEARLAAFHAPSDEDAFIRIGLVKSLQQEIWSIVIVALREASPPATQMLLPALNEMIGVTVKHSVAVKTHTEPLILGALASLALFCALLAGYSLAGGKPFSMFMHMLGFALVTTVTIYVIVDLDYPRSGFIRVDFADQALVDVLEGIKW